MKAKMKFYFDVDCGFCQACVRVLARLAEFDSVAARADVPSLPAEVRSTIASEASAYDGHRFSYGHEAIGVVLRHGGRTALIRAAGTLILASPLRPVLSRAYAFIAARRHKMGKLVGAQACALPQPDSAA